MPEHIDIAGTAATVQRHIHEPAAQHELTPFRQACLLVCRVPKKVREPEVLDAAKVFVSR
jgi:hypothetical protein